MENIAFENGIEKTSKSRAVPLPTKISDVDTDKVIYTNIIDAADNGVLDVNVINSFTNISKSRDEVYNLLDLMGDDPIIASALEIYASDVCEPNDFGRIVWAESDDSKVLGAVDMILNSINIDKNAYGWVYSLIKYGDLYLRLYRQSELEDANIEDRQNIREDGMKLHEELKQMNEDIIMKIFSKNDKYANYMEAVKNPAEVFNLYRLGKSYGYIRTHIPNSDHKKLDMMSPYEQTMFNNIYKFNRNDIDIYAATEYVHASLDDFSNRDTEEVSIYREVNGINPDGTDSTTTSTTFQVKRGQSVLYNAFKVWRELNLLENSVLLNRVTKSSIIRVISYEVGDMDRAEVRTLGQRIKQMVEQKSAINTNASLREYTNAGPMENTIYVPTHDGKGAITADQMGGDVDVGDLQDLDYWKKKLYAALGIPGQYLGDTADSTGFNGGTSLSLISSRYAKNIKRIQNAFSQAITDAVNLMLLDKGLLKYINKFTIRMQAPTTQEEKDRKDNMNNSIAIIQSVMSLIEIIQDPKRKLSILKTMLATTLTDPNVIALIQEEIEALETEVGGVETDDLDGDLGGGVSDFEAGLPSPEEVLSGEAPAEDNGDSGTESEPLDTGAEESFYNGKGSRLDEDDLPSFADLGVSYTDIH